MGKSYTEIADRLGRLDECMTAAGMGTATTRLLLLMAGDGNKGQAHSAARLGVTPQAVSQAAIRLCDVVDHGGNRRGLGYVRISLNPSNMRERVYALTPRGRAVAKRLVQEIGSMLA